MADRIKTDFGSLTNNKLWTRGGAVVLALTGNIKYLNPPVTMVMLQSLLDALEAAIVDAMDGGKMARTKRDALRTQVISALNQIAVYVQENANGDPSGTGFETYSPTRKTAQLVTTPSFRKIYDGANSGEIMLLINRVPYARGYQVRYAVVQDGVLGEWVVVDIMSVKSAFKISGLKPVTKYAFQVQAIGTVNRSDWSNSKTFSCGL
jgi:hypothetical protein